MALTEKQIRFCKEYLIDLNATRAYKRAGYSVKSDAAAATEGSKLLRNPKVQEEIDKLIKRREKRTEIKQDDVINELAAIAFQNISDYAKVIQKPAYINDNGKRVKLLDENGKPVMYETVELTLTDNLTDKQKKAISYIKTGKYGIEIGTYNKVDALELLGRHLGMFKDKVEVSGLDEEKSKLDDIIKQMRGGE